MKLSPKQVAVLRFIRDYRRQHAVAPYLKEIAEHFGCAKVTIHEHLRKLESKGAISKERSQPRGLCVLYDPDAHGDASRPRTHIRSHGHVSAGALVDGSPSSDAWVDLETLIECGPRRGVVRVKGTGLEREHITAGDVLVVDRRVPNDGDVVLAFVDSGEAVVKRVTSLEEGWLLSSPSGAVPPMIRTQVRFFAVVDCVVRRLV